MTMMDFGDDLAWHKSTRSAETGGDCLYAAPDGNQVGIRDSKEGRQGKILWCAAGDFEALRTSVAK